MLSAEKGKLRYYYDSETVILEAWGDNSRASGHLRRAGCQRGTGPC